MARTKTTPQHSPTQRNLRTRTPTSSQPPPQANPESPDVCAVNGVSYFSNDSNNSATNSHRNETNRSRSVRESTMPDESESSNDVNNQSNTESNESDNSSNHEDNNRTDRTANNTVIQRTPATRSRKQNNKISKIFKEIARLQMSTSLLIPKLSFQRVVREILMDINSEAQRMTGEAIEALRESAEMYIIELLEDANAATLHRGRVTLLPKDIQLVQYLRRNNVSK